MRIILILATFFLFCTSAGGKEIVSCWELRLQKEGFQKRNVICTDTLTGVRIDAPYVQFSQAREIVQWIKGMIVNKFGPPGGIQYQGNTTIVFWRFFEMEIIPDRENDTLKIKLHPPNTSI